MRDANYCTLYVDTDEGMDDLQAVMTDLAGRIFMGLEVDPLVYRNVHFDARSRSKVPYDFIECSRYYVEVGTLEPVPSPLADFQSGVGLLVKRLREEGRFVTASCDFEDVVADVSGWNWRKENPEPPGRSDRESLVPFTNEKGGISRSRP